MLLKRLRSLLVSSFLFLLALPSIFAAGLFDPLSMIGFTITNLFNGSLIYVSEDSFIRFVYWLTLFTVVYFIGVQRTFKVFNSDDNKGVAKKMGMIIALVLATTGTVFTPIETLRFLFQLYSGILVMLLLIGIFVFIYKYVYSKEFLKEHPTFLHLVRIIAHTIFLFGIVLGRKYVGLESIWGFEIAGYVDPFMLIMQIIIVIMLIIDIVGLFGSFGFKFGKGKPSAEPHHHDSEHTSHDDSHHDDHAGSTTTAPPEEPPLLDARAAPVHTPTTTTHPELASGETPGSIGPDGHRLIRAAPNAEPPLLDVHAAPAHTPTTTPQEEKVLEYELHIKSLVDKLPNLIQIIASLNKDLDAIASDVDKLQGDTALAYRDKSKIGPALVDCQRLVQQIDKTTIDAKSNLFVKDFINALTKEEITLNQSLTQLGTFLGSRQTQSDREEIKKIEEVKQAASDLAILLTQVNTELQAHKEVVLGFEKTLRELEKNPENPQVGKKIEINDQNEASIGRTEKKLSKSVPRAVMRLSGAATALKKELTAHEQMLKFSKTKRGELIFAYNDMRTLIFTQVNRLVQVSGTSNSKEREKRNKEILKLKEMPLVDSQKVKLKDVLALSDNLATTASNVLKAIPQEELARARPEINMIAGAIRTLKVDFKREYGKLQN